MCGRCEGRRGPEGKDMKKKKEMQDRIEVLFETISTRYYAKSSTIIGIYAHVYILFSLFIVNSI